jgi:ABC-type transport system, involved in lipoprotein release, permease component
MRLVDYLNLAWMALWERRGRTIGAVVGVVIAIVALGLAIGAGQGFKALTTGFFENVFGINTVVLFPSGTAQLTLTDMATVSALPHVASVEPILEAAGSLNVNGYPQRVQVIGVTADELMQMYGVTMLNDALISGNPTLQAGVVLVGYDVAFTNTGQEVIYPGQLITITVNGKVIRAIVGGVLKPGSIGLIGVNPNTAIFMDTSSFLGEIDPSGVLRGLIVHVDKPSYVNTVTNMLQSLYPQDQVFNLSTVLTSVNQFYTTLELFLAFISGISFIIIGIWMFDTTTISVIQRTREFGIMRAVGLQQEINTNPTANRGINSGHNRLGNRHSTTDSANPRNTHNLTPRQGPIAGFRGPARGFVGVTTTFNQASSAGVNLPIPIVITPPYLALLFIIPLATNVVAALIPAIRASRIPPAQTLRYE